MTLPMTDEAGLDTARTGRAAPAPGRLRLLRPTGPATLGDPAWGPGSPPATDVTSLVIDLTDELGRDPPPRERQVCRPMVRRELTRIAAIHADQLPDGFFVRFGTRFLATYLGTFVAGPYATALALGPPGAPVAFVVGTVDNARHYRWLMRNAGPLARAGFVALIARPGLAYQLVRTRGRRYARSVLRHLRMRAGPPRTEHPSGSVPEVAPVVAVLTHVAVATDEQGTGLGRVLVEAFVAHARARGADEVRLIAHAHTRTPGFYRRLGWSSLGERSASDGSLVEEFRIVL